MHARTHRRSTRPKITVIKQSSGEIKGCVAAVKQPDILSLFPAAMKGACLCIPPPPTHTLALPNPRMYLRRLCVGCASSSPRVLTLHGQRDGLTGFVLAVLVVDGLRVVASGIGRHRGQDDQGVVQGDGAEKSRPQ